MAEFPATLSALRLRVLRLLEDMAYLDPLAADVTSTTTQSWTVTTPAQWPKGGRWEVGTEVVLVLNNSGSNPITVQRAFESSTAATHTNGDIARRDPRFLTASVNEAINVVVNDWCSFYFPQLVWDTTTGGSFNPVTWIINAPTDALSVKRVTWKLPGYNKYRDVAHSDLQSFPTSEAANGLGFELYEMGLAGMTVNVLYGKRWPFLTLDTDSVPADFPGEADDLLVTGAALYLLGWRSIPKFRYDEVEFHRELNQAMPPNLNLTELKQLYDNWHVRAKEIAAKRPERSSPTVVWRGVSD